MTMLPVPHLSSTYAPAQSPWPRDFVVLPLMVLCGFLISVPAEGQTAVLYRCTDPTGASVFTDTPAQLHACQELSTETADSADAAPLHLSPPGPSAASPEFVPDEPRGGTEVREADQITVPVRRIGSLLIVTSTVNGSRDAHLILDTGASHTILSPDVAYELGLLGDPNSRLVTLNTAGGPVQAEMVRVDSIRIAGAEVQNSVAAIYALPDTPPGIDGLLGLTFLRQFQVTLDTAKGLLHLRKAGN